MRPILELNSRDAVEKAIKEYDQLGQDAFLKKHGYGPAKEYLLRHEGSDYDSKAIVGVAYGYQFPGKKAAFSGGGRTAGKILKSLGFDVVLRSDAGPTYEEATREIKAITNDINRLSKSYEIGSLQKLRASLKKMSHPASHNIFSAASIKEDYAFHLGGRSELQFNVGFERIETGRIFRHGVAFSLEPGQTLPDPVKTLTPKIILFNDHMDRHAQLYRDFRMWHFEGGQRSFEYMPSPIPWERVKSGVFIFLGRHRLAGPIDYQLVLSDMDCLLPLYRYVEGDQSISASRAPPVAKFNFKPGCSLKPTATVANSVQRQLDVSLRHNALQHALYDRLVSEFGEPNVGTENFTALDTRIDVAVRRGDEYTFYEIKTALRARDCIREALGQLLEYAFWLGKQGVTRLIVVGEGPLDQEGKLYLAFLRSEFALPIEYEQATF